jgi:hypothetical protein
LIVPVIVGWTWQLNAYVPGASNVQDTVHGALAGGLGIGGGPAAPPTRWHEAGFALEKLTL